MKSFEESSGSATDAACAFDQLIRSAYPDEIHLSFPLRLAPKSVFQTCQFRTAGYHK